MCINAIVIDYWGWFIHSCIQILINLCTRHCANVDRVCSGQGLCVLWIQIECLPLRGIFSGSELYSRDVVRGIIVTCKYIKVLFLFTFFSWIKES